jgi:hypothetical protein
MLRRWLIGLSIFAVVVTGALVLAGAGRSSVVFAWIGVQGAIVLIAVVAERGRYQPATTASEGWVRTEERFRDPTSGDLLEVEFNPTTGERRYVPSGPSSDPPPQEH